MSNDADFLSAGYDQVDEDVRRSNEAREKSNARRLWVKPNSHVDVIFLEDEPVRIEEFRFFLSGHWNNFYTKRRTGDPFLESGFKPYPVYCYTVLDLTTWTDKRGQEHKNERRLLVVRQDQAKLLKEKRDSWGGLKHKMVRIRRKGDKDSASGSDFELCMKNGTVVVPDMKQYKEILPFEYAKILAPVTSDEARRVIALAARSQMNGEAVSMTGDAPAAGAGTQHSQDSEPEVDTSGSTIPF